MTPQRNKNQSMGNYEPEQAELARLYSYIRTLIRCETFDDVLNALIQSAIDMLGVKKALVASVHPETRYHHIYMTRGGELRNSPDLFSKQNENLAALIEHNEHAFCLSEDASDKLFFDKSLSMLGFSFRLSTADCYIIVVEDERPNFFAERHIKLFDELVSQSIEIIKQRHKLEESKQENILLWDMKTRIGEAAENLDETNLPLLLKRILDLCLARTKTRRGVIMILDEETGDLVLESQAVKGELIADRLPERFTRRRGDRASGIVFKVIDSNKPYIANDIETDPNYVPLFRGILSTLAVPISFQNRAIGAIVIESRRRNAFTLEDQRALVDISRSVAMFVRRAQLFSLTNTESETGIMIRGLSPEWEEVERRVEKAAATDASVILRGESGTGKELVAHSLHFNSLRRKKPFVVVNCAAIPSELIESELFGHKKGAFTGAAYDHTGKIELASGGTLFMDEIGDLTPPLQVKLLRFLQNGEIQPIGSEAPPKRIDVRLIAATSRNLEKMLQEGSFREDLYYRLHVVPIYLPPLRSYRKSIPGMARAFMEQASRKFNKEVKNISEKALAMFMRYDYPGNVRELRNIVERAVILADGETIDIADMPQEIKSRVSEEGGPTFEMPVFESGKFDYKKRKEELLKTFEVQFLTELLKTAKGNITEASELSGIRREQLYPMFKRAGIDPASFRE